MYVIECPACQTANEVSPARAGDQIRCSSCDGAISVPKLGELRQLPTTGDPSATAAPTASVGSRSFGYAAMAILAAGLLCFSAYCGVRWALIDSTISTEGHLAEINRIYREVNSAQLIREWEDINKLGIELPIPYNYRTIELDKQSWGRNAMVFLGGGLASMLAAAFVGRRSGA